MFQIAQRTLVMRSDHEAGLQRAIDGVFGDQRAHERLRFLGEVPQIARVPWPQPFLQCILFLAVAGMDLSAVAAGGAETGAVGFEQHDLGAALRQMQRGRQPGIASAHHADIGLHGAFEAWPRRRRGRAGGVIALWRF